MSDSRNSAGDQSETLNGSSLNGFEWWRRSMQYKTGLGLSSEEKIKYERDSKTKANLDECDACYKLRDYNLQFSPLIVFMVQQIKKAGGSITDKNIICDVCDENNAGGFHPDLGILLCQNHLKTSSHLEDTLAHELVHYYDNTKFKVDWFNLRHHACSEIRASSLSGECRLTQQFFRINKISKGHQECTRRRAILSVSANPECKDKEHATKIVDEVWDSCFNDTRPFERIYR